MTEEEPKIEGSKPKKSLPESDIMPDSMDQYGCPISEEAKNPLWVGGGSLELDQRKQELVEEWAKFGKRMDEALDHDAKERMAAFFYAAKAKIFLLEFFGIDNLNSTEERGLRYIADFYVRNHKRQWEIYKEAKEKGDEPNGHQYMGEPSKEIMNKWIKEFCGVSSGDIPYWGVLIDQETGELVYFIQRNSEQAAEVSYYISMKRIEEVEKGEEYHKFKSFCGVPYYFKEYLWNQRRNNEAPESD